MPDKPATPPRGGKRNPDLLTATDAGQGPQIDAPSPEEIAEAQHHDDPGEVEMLMPELVYAGDIITASATLAVVLPGDDKESYFGFKHTTHVQEGEGTMDASGRVITFVREGVIGAIDDMIDSLTEYNAQLQSSGRISSS
jgi:hypothetical protein